MTTKSISEAARAMGKPLTLAEFAALGGKAKHAKHGVSLTFADRSKGGKKGGIRSGEVRRAKRDAAISETSPPPPADESGR